MTLLIGIIVSLSVSSCMILLSVMWVTIIQSVIIMKWKTRSFFYNPDLWVFTNSKLGYPGFSYDVWQHAVAGYVCNTCIVDLDVRVKG